MPLDSPNTPPDSTRPLSSSEKKRLRDRKAQKTQRDKRESRIKTLEERVEFCERNHEMGSATGCVRELLASVDTLREENGRLRARQERVKGLVRGWEVEDTKAPACGNGGIAAAAEQEIMGSAGAPRGEATSGMDLGSTSSPIYLPLSTIQIIPPDTVPVWSLLPMQECGDSTVYLPPWLARPDLTAACPSQPSSPLDLLHGTRRNFLADQINRAVRRRALRDSECLALGWLVYLFSMWLVTPTPATFSRIATFQHPVPMQLQREHPTLVDLIIWPQMRANLVRHWERYDFVELTGYFSCCIKVRWPWGVDVLERDGEDVLRIKREFSDVFFSESGWGITSEFIDKYPELLEGMDVEAVRFYMALPDVSDLGA